MSTVKLLVKALYINVVDRFACPEFFSVLNVETEQEDKPAILCGVGDVLKSSNRLDAYNFLPGSRVLFYAFGKAAFTDTIELSTNCVVPVDSDADLIQSVSAGMILPLIAAAEDAKLTLGDRVLLLARNGLSELAKNFYESIGCVVMGGTLADWETEGFADKILQESNGLGADAIIMLGVEPAAEMQIQRLCPRDSRIIHAKGTGAGYDDAEYMCGKIDYPHGYTRRTTKDNLEYALQTMQSSTFKIDCATICADNDVPIGEEVIILKDESKGTEPAAQEDARILPEESRIRLDELKRECAERLSPCLLQVTVCCDTISEQTKSTLLTEVEYLLGTTTAHMKTYAETGIWALSANESDGSVVVIHAISGFQHEKSRYELHFDSHTFVLDQNELKKL